MPQYYRAVLFVIIQNLSFFDAEYPIVSRHSGIFRICLWEHREKCIREITDQLIAPITISALLYLKQFGFLLCIYPIKNLALLILFVLRRIVRAESRLSWVAYGDSRN